MATLLGKARHRQASNNRKTVYSVGRAKAVSEQRLSKHIPATTDMKATIGELYFLCGPCRDVITWTVGAMISVVSYE
jgi:hypothetical protein